MKNLFTIFLFFAALELAGQSENIDVEYINLIDFSSGDSIFPDSWLNSEVQAKATPIAENQKVRSQEIIVIALKKYPREIVQKYLSKIYVVSSIEFYGLAYGGTNSAANIYISNRGFSDEWIEKAFHSEFSSILLRNHKIDFDQDNWVIKNDTGIIYGKSGVEALRAGNSSTAFNEKLNEKGILYPYALSSVENDFNSYAENLFCGKETFWDLTQKYQRIDAKTQLVINFYHSLNKELNFDYFRAMAIQ